MCIAGNALSLRCFAPCFAAARSQFGSDLPPVSHSLPKCYFAILTEEAKGGGRGMENGGSLPQSRLCRASSLVRGSQGRGTSVTDAAYPSRVEGAKGVGRRGGGTEGRRDGGNTAQPSAITRCGVPLAGKPSPCKAAPTSGMDIIGYNPVLRQTAGVNEKPDNEKGTRRQSCKRLLRQ